MRTPLVAAAAAALLLLTGCAGASSTTEVSEISTPAATTPAAEAAETISAPEAGGVSERGHQIIAVGQENQLWDADLPVGTWTVNSVEQIDPNALQTETNPDTSKPYFEYDTSLTYYAVEISANATSDLQAKMSFVFSGIDADGVKVNNGVVHIAQGLPDEYGDFPTWINMGEKIHGKELIGIPGDGGGALIITFSGGSAQGMPTGFGFELPL